MISNRRIYLDYNATTPVTPEVLASMLPYFSEAFGNSSSSDHSYGWEAQEAVDLAREWVAALIGARAGEIVFTSGATEAANLAIWGVAGTQVSGGGRILCCSTEHRAVLEPVQHMQNKGFRVSWLGVDESGRLSPAELEQAMTEDTILVCTALANNETGVLHPIRAVAEIARSRGAYLLCDATQAVGKIPVDVSALGVDLLVFSSHKLYGPKGAGALYINRERGLRLEPVIRGGGQERGQRPGTLNVPAIVGFGTACRLVRADLQNEEARQEELRELLEARLSEIPGSKIAGRSVPRLPNTVNVSFEGIDGGALIRALKGVAISRGAACSSNTVRPSHVLTAMGLGPEEALGSVRISLGRPTRREDVEEAIVAFHNAIQRLYQQGI